MYIELHTASAFSFLEGASLPERLVDRAAELGYPAIALLDRDGVYGAPRFHKAAKAAGIRPIVGAELTMGHAAARQVEPPRGGGARLAVARQFESSRGGGVFDGGRSFISADAVRTWRLPVLVESQAGYRNLCRAITRAKLAAEKGEAVLALDDLEGNTAGLVALIGRESLVADRHGVGGLVDRLVGLFGRGSVYVALERHFVREEEADNQALVALASAFHVPIIATNGVRFSTPDERPLFDVLTCIRHKTTLEEAGRRLAANAERYLKPPAEMAALFDDYPEAVAATGDLADRLQYTMADLGYRFPAYPVPPGETMISFLRKMTDVGARERYRPYHEKARRQIARELDLIEKLDLAGYFLIVWDIVNFCRQNRILVQGRGSAANSAVCYSLGITAVDPVGMDLLFERFLSEERGEWPDIDLDLPSGDRRERVIQHVYEKYGRLGAAMTANVITYRGRSAAREVGKALGIDAAEIDRLAKVMGHFEFKDPAETFGHHVQSVGFDLADPRIQLFGSLWQAVQDLPRHLGQHSGGMVVCEGQLDAVVPLENASMPGRVVVQWDKDDCADMGIVKIDLLGLGMMAVLQDALELINQPAFAHETGEGCHAEARRAKADSTAHETGEGCHAEARRAKADSTAHETGEGCHAEARRAKADSTAHETGEGCHAEARGAKADSTASSRTPLGLWNLPQDDPEVYRMLQAADTMGVFQVESRAQMATLPRLKPARFYDIVVEVAIIRPGPIVGQMVHPYLNRRAGREPVIYPHPSLEPILARTLGVPLFQEQLLRIAMVAAGFSGGQAEELRRAFGFKRSERRMQQIEVQLREGMAKKGITGKSADDIIRSITSFALYGFPESHSASFALLVYASAYLKAHFPAAFYMALLNNQPMGFYHPATLVKDAQRRGVRFAPIDVERSGWLCAVESDGAIRLGLCYVSGLRADVGHAIEATARSATPLSRRPEATERRAGAAGLNIQASVEPQSSVLSPQSFLVRCPKCRCDDRSMIERVAEGPPRAWFCNNCAHDWREDLPRVRFRSVEDLIARTGINREELATLGEIGALNAFGCDRREALWQIERAVRPAGELYEETEEKGPEQGSGTRDQGPGTGDQGPGTRDQAPGSRDQGAGRKEGDSVLRPQPSVLRSSSTCPLPPMSPLDRVVADYQGTGLTIGPHPMALRRGELSLRGVLPAGDLPRERHGRRVRVAGMVITRQRPGTAKGFVFLTLEDETGISNIIIRPDMFERDRLTIIDEPFLLVEGALQNQEGVTSVRAERLEGLRDLPIDSDSHDFY